MTLLWEKFIKIMSQLLKNYQVLLQLNKTKRQVLIKADIEGLTNITKQEEILFLKINKSETERQAIIREIAAAAADAAGVNAVDGTVNTLSELSSLAEEKYAKPIEKLGAQLLECIKQLQSLSELNAILISKHLEFIEFNTNVLLAASCEQTYSATPGDLQVKRRSILNTEA